MLVAAILAACGDNAAPADPDSGPVEPDAAPPDGTPPVEICDNDFDDDGDHVVDCSDEDCLLVEYCQPEMACGDGEDNDRDGDQDCDDEDCALAVNCQPEALCGNGVDEDLDGETDCDDDDCRLFCLAGCLDGQTLIALEPTGLPAPIDATADVVLAFPVTMEGWISGIAVHFTIEHTFPADLDLTLRSPGGGPTVDLTSDNGGTGQNYTDTYLSDRATSSIVTGAAPFDGTFRPEQPFARIVGLPSLGTWQILVHDDFNGENGTISDVDFYACICEGGAGCEKQQACLDGEDNDGDTLIDCADVDDCGAMPQCEPETACDDDVDNNLDGETDCQDPDCNGIAGCEHPEVSCTDLADNDDDLLADCDDPDCGATGHCLPEADCGDGTDDDSDGLADCLDVGCDGIQGCELGVEVSCVDGFDNDGDGAVDCADTNCEGTLACTVTTCGPGMLTIDRVALDLPQAIASNATIKSTIPITQGGLVQGIAVKLDVTHSFDSDLDIFLDGPGGSVELTTDNGSSGDNYTATVFLDSATTLITAGTAPFTGQFRPEQSLAGLAGTPVSGDWILRVSDDAAGDVGTLDRFEVLICHCDPALGDCEFGPACRNGVDDDNDSIVDCAETTCAADPFCIPEATCTGGVDEDLDGLIDCLDPDCNGISGCEVGVELTCTDGFDNDADTLVDCADPNCFATPHCQAEPDCGDGTDDDSDGLIDCLDVGCDGMMGCELGTEESCADGFDNDGDGTIDCADGDCAVRLFCNVTCPAGTVGAYGAAADLPQEILSNATINSIIPVATAGAVQQVAVKLDITHTRDSDLDIFLDAPGGSVELSTDNGSSNDNFAGTVFIDTAATLVTAGTAPFAGQFRPEQPLSNLFGTALTGDWTLRVTDDLTGDQGTLRGYQVLVCHCDPSAGNCEFGLACRNAVDDDSDTLIDCADPNCATDPFCIPETDCDDGIDEDLDGLTDCADPHCNGVSGCEHGVELSCADGFDNDADGPRDCFDSDCSASPACQAELSCNNGLDDDANGDIDCADISCQPTAWCLAEVDCDDGLDNDGDGATDCADVGCDGLDGCVLADETACDDGIDNDADGTADCDDDNCALTCAIPSCPVGSEKVFYRGSGLPIAIPDSAVTNPAISTIDTTFPGLVSQVAVRVDITHTFAGDVDMFLRTPNGQYELSTDNGSSGDNYAQTVFVEPAPGRIGAAGFTTAPFTGAFMPEGTLTGLAGVSAVGSWDLVVADDAGGDTGTLTNYELMFCQCDASSGDCEQGPYACRNGVDDDGDALVDCAEPSCASDPTCAAPPPASEEVCNDGLDDDGDGSTDCADSECAWVCNALGSVCAAPRQLLRYGAVDLPRAIPTTIPFEANSPFQVTRSGMIVRAAVRFNALHTAAGNLSLFLSSPAGTLTELTSGNGGTGDNYVDTVFVDTAAGTIGTSGFTTAPFTGMYRPEQPLFLVAFEDSLGLWSAQLRDLTNNDGGSWTEASLGLCIIP